MFFRRKFCGAKCCVKELHFRALRAFGGKRFVKFRSENFFERFKNRGKQNRPSPIRSLGIYKGCSASAKCVLQHIFGVDAVPPEIPKAVSLTKTYAAQRVKTNENEVVVSVAKKDWPNACLGMPGNSPEDEFCAELITPGYEATLRVKGVDFIYRTNMDGTQIRPAN